MVQKISFVTGVAGLIGHSLAIKLMQEDHIVIGLDSLVSGDIQNIKHLESLQNQIAEKKFYFIQGRVQDPWGRVDSILKSIRDHSAKKNIQLKPTYIFHFASIAEPSKFSSHYRDIMEAASIGTMRATDFCAKEDFRLVLASTSEVYGLSQSLPMKESDPGVVNCNGERSSYNEAKRFAESWVVNTNQSTGTNHGIVRIFNTYGPGLGLDDARVVPSLIRSALAQKNIRIFGDGTRTRSFCYVDDLVKGIWLYANSNLSIPVNIGNDQEISILELAQTIIKLTESNSRIEFEPPLKDETEKRIPDLTLARTKLGYAPQVGLIEGLQKTIDNVKERTAKLNPIDRAGLAQSL